MPMYEYGCQSCNSRFDLLRRMDQDDAEIICPVCHSKSVQRRLSVFASYSRGSSSESMAEASAPVTKTTCSGACATCSHGSRS
ncbi:MAG: zinc ribbon domain-containing protein [Oscillochloris sp.]|nr:zinc ribbon domain-containing protein [Oscillochloris sp.]